MFSSAISTDARKGLVVITESAAIVAEATALGWPVVDETSLDSSVRVEGVDVTWDGQAVLVVVAKTELALRGLYVLTPGDVPNGLHMPFVILDSHHLSALTHLVDLIHEQLTTTSRARARVNSVGDSTGEGVGTSHGFTGSFATRPVMAATGEHNEAALGSQSDPWAQ